MASHPAPIKLGIAGIGLAGAMMIRAARTHPNFELTAGFDPLPRPGEAFAADFGARIHGEFEALCNDPDVEAVYIASPHEFHADQAIMALKHGKHVLVEKPLALTPEACDPVIAAAAAAESHLIVGHTHGFDPNVRQIRCLIEGGELGRLGMILAFNYNSFLYRPRRPEELDTSRGGGITFNQVMHQIEIARLLGGGLVRSVRANAGSLDPTRPTEGNANVFLEFEDGASASLIFSAYDHFDSDEFHGWISESGTLKEPGEQGAIKRRLLEDPSGEADRQKDGGYGGRLMPMEQPHLPHFGTIIVTLEGGDIRLSPDGVFIYDGNGCREVAAERGPGRPGHGDALDALWGAVREGRRDFHDAGWGKASVEVVQAILQSSRERREITLAHQVAADG